MKKKFKSKFKIINLVHEVEPIVIENTNKKWVIYGKDNMYPQYLVNLSRKTGLHTAILNKKVMMDISEGFTYEGPTNKLTDDFIKKCNPNESLYDIGLKCFTDLEIQGGFYLEPLFNDKGMLIELRHIPFQNVRTSGLNEDGSFKEFYYYEDWKPYISNHSKIETKKAYKGKPEKSYYYSKKYAVGNIFYPLPGYVGVTLDIETLSAISTSHNANLKNNFQPGAIFILKPGPNATDEEIEDQIRDIEDQIGEDGTGAVMLIVKDSRDETPEFSQFEVSDIDKRFKDLSKTTISNIITAHNIPRVIAGAEISGSLGGSKEHVEGNIIFYNEYIKKQQEFLLNHFNDLLSKYGYSTLLINNQMANPYMYDSTLLKENLTQNEIRELLGYPELEEEQTTQQEDKKEEDKDD